MNYLIVITNVQPNFGTNIMESIQTNNKKKEKITFLMKNSCIRAHFGMKKRYF